MQKCIELNGPKLGPHNPTNYVQCAQQMDEIAGNGQKTKTRCNATAAHGGKS